MTDEEVWNLVLDNDNQLRSLCRKAAKSLTTSKESQLTVAEELYSDVVLARAIRIMRTYREDKPASPSTHLYGNVRWYLYKEVVIRNKRRANTASMGDHDYGDDSKVEPTTETGIILESLPGGSDSTYAKILWWLNACGYTQAEVADHLDVSIAQVSKLHKEAIAYARGEQ